LLISELSAKELAHLINLSERRVHQLTSDNIISKNDNNKYLACDAIDKYYKFKYDTTSCESLDKEKAKHEEVKRKLSELKLKKIERDLVSLEEVEYAMINVIANCKAKLLGLASKIAPRIVSEDNINLIREEIDIEIRSALTELSNYRFEDVAEEDEDEEES